MKNSQDFVKSITSIFSGKFAFFASLASIVGLVIVFVSNSLAVWIALIFFCSMLLIFTIYLVLALYKILDVKQAEHENRSTFIKYETSDGNLITYETYKLIQVKKPVLTEMDYHFKWSGTHLPKISSDLQQVVSIVDEQDPTKYDRAVLKFQKPVYYNQNLVLHFKAILDDTDKKAESFLETRVLNEIDIIHYRIILKNKAEGFGQNAVLECCKIGLEIRAKFQHLREIPFDATTKSYEYHLLKPEIGYYYRISWEK